MHKGAFWVGPDTPVTDLAKLMHKNDIGAVPIGENDRLIGMVATGTLSAKVWRRMASTSVARRRGK